MPLDCGFRRAAWSSGRRCREGTSAGSCRICGKHARLCAGDALRGSTFACRRRRSGCLSETNPAGAARRRRTGKITKSEREVARIQVVSATDENCQAKLLSGEIKPDEDDEDDPYKKYVVRFTDPDQDKMSAKPAVPAAAPANDAAPF